jgi:hypothetical protein
MSVRLTRVAMVKREVLHNYYECVSVALDIQHATRVRHIVICDVSLASLYVYILSHKRHEFREEKSY